LKQARVLLNASTAEEKSIVLLSDGAANASYAIVNASAFPPCKGYN